MPSLAMLWLGLCLGLLTAASARSTPSNAVRAPIILVPGLGGSVLESKLTNVTQPHLACSGDHDWQVEWVAPSLDLLLIECLLQNLKVLYDPKTQRYSNNTGVEIRPYKFGGLEGVAALDPQLPDTTATYATMIQALADVGYREGVDLFGAPYDFRLAADGLEQIGWFKRFQNLIEEAVDRNHGQPAVLIAHSMGNLVTYYFMKQMEVPVHCIYGTDVNTEVGYGYDLQHFGSKKVPPAPRRISQGPGDGTVNLRSLKSCVQLGPMAEQHVPSPNATHLGILMDDAAIDLVVDLVRRLQRETPGPFVRSRSGGPGGGSLFGRVNAALSAIF